MASSIPAAANSAARRRPSRRTRTLCTRFRGSPSFERRSLRPVTDDAHRPAVLPEPRSMPGAQGGERVLLGLESLQNEHDAVRWLPKAIGDGGTRSGGSRRGGAPCGSATNSLIAISPLKLAAIAGASKRAAGLRPLDGGEVARADDRCPVKRPGRDGHAFGNRHVDVAYVLLCRVSPADLRASLSVAPGSQRIGPRARLAMKVGRPADHAIPPNLARPTPPRLCRRNARPRLQLAVTTTWTTLGIV